MIPRNSTHVETLAEEPQLIWRLNLKNMEIVADAFERVFERLDDQQAQINELRQTALLLGFRKAWRGAFPTNEPETYMTADGYGDTSVEL